MLQLVLLEMVDSQQAQGEECSSFLVVVVLINGQSLWRLDNSKASI